MTIAAPLTKVINNRIIGKRLKGVISDFEGEDLKWVIDRR